MALSGGRVGTLKKLKASIKKSSGSNSPIRYIPKEGGKRVRFLTEPTEWIEWYEHFDENKKISVGCVQGTCKYCAEDVRRSKRFLTAVVDIDDGKNVIALNLPVSVVNQLVKKYERYHTLLDRDYEIVREGAGLDTEYEVNPEAPTRMRLDGYEVPDLMQILEDNADPDGGADDDDDDEDEKPARVSRTTAKPPVKKAPLKKPLPRSRPSILDEDDDEDEDDDTPPPRRTIRKEAPAKRMVKKSIRR